MFCSKCGKQLNEGAAFCDGCGASINGGATSSSEVISYSEAVKGLEKLNPEEARKAQKLIFVIVNLTVAFFDFILCSLPFFSKFAMFPALFNEEYESKAEMVFEYLWDKYTMICVAIGAVVLTSLIIKIIKLRSAYRYEEFIKYEIHFAVPINTICLAGVIIPYFIFLKFMNGLALFMVLSMAALSIGEFIVNLRTRRIEIINIYKKKTESKDYLHSDVVKINRGPVKKVELNSDGMWECEECGTFNPSTQNYCKDCGKYI